MLPELSVEIKIVEIHFHHENHILSDFKLENYSLQSEK